MEVLLLALLGAGVLALLIGPVSPSKVARLATGRSFAVARAVAKLTGLEHVGQSALGVCRLAGRLNQLTVVLRISATEGNDCQAHIEVTGGVFLPAGATIRSQLGPLHGRMALSGALRCEPWAAWRRAAKHVVRPHIDALHPRWSDVLARFDPGDLQLTVEPECFSAHTNFTEPQELADMVSDLVQELVAISRPWVYR